MKELMKKFNENKVQFFFFIGVFGLLIVALVVSASMNPTIDKPIDPNIDNPDNSDDDDDVTTPQVEVIKAPIDGEFVIVRKFYEKDGTKEEQELSLIKYGTSYRTSSGTSYAKKDGSQFDVLASLSGKVYEVKESPLYGNYVVLEHDNDVKTYYYGLKEVTVTVGSEITQGTKLGTSGETEIDKDAKNHVYFKVVVGSTHLNPEKAIGKKTEEVK